MKRLPFMQGQGGAGEENHGCCDDHGVILIPFHEPSCHDKMVIQYIMNIRLDHQKNQIEDYRAWVIDLCWSKPHACRQIEALHFVLLILSHFHMT